jgi:hypothetical protein
MTPQRPLLGAALLFVLAPLLPALADGNGSGDSRRIERCRTEGATFTANSRVRVFRRGPPSLYRAFACYRATGARYRLGVNDFGDEQTARLFRVAGNFVAYDSLDCIMGNICDANIRVLNARTGRRRDSRTAKERVFEADDLVVTRGGQVAWIRRHRGQPEVRKLDGDGEEVLDVGDGIDRTSLRLRGRTVSWNNSGQTKQATLRAKS